jgi:hypothetical protein
MTMPDALYELCGTIGITRRKAFQYLGLFCFLVVIYAMGLPDYLTRIKADIGDATVGNLFGPLVKFAVVSALPLGMLAYSDQSWRSSDAAPVCLTAWGAVSICLSSKYPCLAAVGFPFLPFILAALLAHGVGTGCRFLKHETR